MNTQDKIYYLEQIAMAADRLVSESADHSVDYWARMQRIAVLMQRLEDTVKEYKRDADQDVFGPQLSVQSKIISDLRRANDGLSRALDGHVSEALGVAFDAGYESGWRIGQMTAENPVDMRRPRKEDQ